LGNSSGDENGSGSVKYWGIVADKLSAAGKRYIVHSDGLLTAFLWLERDTPR